VMSPPVMSPPVMSPGTVVITGASSGIGRAATHVFGRHGWRVGLIARGERNLDATRKDVVTAAAAAVRDPNLNGAGQAQSATHGPFDSESRETSVQIWANENRGPALLLGLGLVGLAVLVGGTAAARPR